MNFIKFLTVLILAVFSTHASAYGSSSSSKKSCKKPKMSQFTPDDKSVVAAESEFSFTTSVLTNPDNIVVTVKKLPVPVTVESEGNAYKVTGKLPATLQDTYARVTINAVGTNGCKTSDGWLLKIESK